MFFMCEDVVIQCFFLIYNENYAFINVFTKTVLYNNCKKCLLLFILSIVELICFTSQRW
jgi:hypothetical protein